MPKHLNQRWVVINPEREYQSALQLQLSLPTGRLSAFVQGIWSSSVPVESGETVKRSLYSDAGSGIVFNLHDEICIGEDVIPKGVIMLPVEKHAEEIALPPGSKLAGIRFFPAVGYGILGQHYDKPTPLAKQDDLYHLHALYARLEKLATAQQHIDALYQWATDNLSITDLIPDALERTLEGIAQDEELADLMGNAELSQRQIERQFKQWLGMTPKYYQRIARIKKAINYMKAHPEADLVDVALRFGFSDQAHMTREFRTIACITPGKIG